MRKLALVAFAAFAVIFSLEAQQGYPGASNPNERAAREAAQAAAAKRGGPLYKQNCAVCHGDDLTGGRGPDLIRSSLVRHDKGGNLISPVVLNGRADRGMPSFPFTQHQVSDVVAYIDSELTLFDLHTRIPGAYPNDIPASRLATEAWKQARRSLTAPAAVRSAIR